MKTDSILYDLSDDELHETRGGDWWERMMGFMIITAFFAGALAAPELLIVAGMTAGSIMAIETLLTWY